MAKQLLPRLALLLLLFLAAQMPALAQEKPQDDDSYKPLLLKLNESGSKYVRFIIWHQQWVQTNNLAPEDTKLQLTTLARRSRFLAYAQISPRFLILTHFGLNNLTPNNLSSLGNNEGSDAAQLFLHDAWTEFKVSHNDALYIGAGLHYWKGLTRLASQSTLNFMTMDNTRPFIHWHSLAVTDQFARHLGLYAKGQFGQFDYRVAINNPGRNGIQRDYGRSSLTYNGFVINDGDDPETPATEGEPTGNTIYEGYFSYSLLERESTKLPFNVGTYLGAKRVFNIGGGFFLHPNGMYNSATNQHESVRHFAVDAFLDTPLGEGNSCLNAYASFMSFDYGENFVSRWAGTGTALYGQLGFKPNGSKFMPYVAYQRGDYEGFDAAVNALDLGLNYFLNGHNAKLTLEYHTISNDTREAAGGDVRQVRVQAHVFL